VAAILNGFVGLEKINRP